MQQSSGESVTTTGSQPWIYSARFDLWFILAPAFFVSAIVVGVPNVMTALHEVPLWAWVVLVMGIDVSHVYSTLYRTYFDSDELNSRPALYLMVPTAAWFVGVLLYSIGPLTFWRVLAYLAVFHFVRQQYGFMMIYRRDEQPQRYARLIDQLVIYLSTIYPLVYWHTTLPRPFSWFVEGDFFSITGPWVEVVTRVIYIAAIMFYVVKEARTLVRESQFNWPKNLLLLGTALSWYLGIVAFNGDIAFTLTNIVSHGVPYIALVWIYGNRKWLAKNKDPSVDSQPLIARVFSIKNLPLFLGLLIALAYFEEALWDSLVWREHGAFFGAWYLLPDIAPSAALVWLVPLLAVPQATHYILDGFIWRGRPDK